MGIPRKKPGGSPLVINYIEKKNFIFYTLKMI